ncbi:glycosyltransferase [Roseateles sp. L2-2]|uniref:glycosyltransferase n=1 Tax=Roseateles sp. L2-2 TaxID=3422597 RepID=UPI003D3670A9
MTTVLVVPSLKISGGTREALRLVSEMRQERQEASVLSMWHSPHAMAASAPVEHLSALPPRIRRAPMEFPLLMWRFRAWLHRTRLAAAPGSDRFIFTHYATVPLALLVPRAQRLFFVQDLEWHFVANKLLSGGIRAMLKRIYRTGRIVSANAYLTKALEAEGLPVAHELPIWADRFFAEGPSPSPSRGTDFAMVLRKGAHKRLDLYLDFIRRCHEAGRSVTVITPEDDIADQVRHQVANCLLRPSAEAMREAYAHSRCFIHLSDHEGFGLPPLEAMGAGCVPVCRDSGGVRAFMQTEALDGLLLSSDMPAERVFETATALLADPARLDRLSQISRELFTDGLSRCADARRHLVHALQ